MSFGHSDICKIFAAGGTCRFGTNCRFVHFRPPEVAFTPVYPAQFQHAGVNQGPSFPHYPPQADYYTGRRVFNRRRNDTGSVCRFFVQNGYCGYGEQCRYNHAMPFEPEHRGEINRANGDLQHKARICTHFQRGNCRFGKNCRYSHDVASTEAASAVTEDAELSGGGPESPVEATENVEGPTPDAVAQEESPAKEVCGPQQQLKRDDVTEEEQIKCRDRELEVMRKRYPQVSEAETEDGDTELTFTFNPSDPDWPFDARSLTLCMIFSAKYPLEICTVAVEDDEIIPEPVASHLEEALNEWLEKRYNHMNQLGRVELVFRSFLKWLDREAEELFTDALKYYQKQLQAEAAGLEFVSATSLKSHYPNAAGDKEGEEEKEEDEGMDRMDRQIQQLQLDGEKVEIETEKNQVTGSLDPAKRGTEVRLHSLCLWDSAATLTCTDLCALVQCNRCTHQMELDTPPQRTNSIQCARCKHTLLVAFRPAMCHEFSWVLGYLDLDQCKAVDLVLPKCTFLINCISCNKDMKFQGLLPGSSKSSWCHACHAKLTVAIETVKFFQLQPSMLEGSSGTHNAHVQKLVKLVKDPSIVRGKPLPDNGICKHYKKSFRWFRFPCCGKAYACDTCHDEKEDHEMKLSNRIICGFCAKEQPYSATHPCTGCHAWMTKKTTSHWEGGRGCRDRVKMSRNDTKKYASTNKTISSKKVKAK